MVPTIAKLQESEAANSVNESSDGKKKKKAVKRVWLPWEFCKLVEPPEGCSFPPFGYEKPASVTDDERNIITVESETLFPVGFYDMTPTKRGVTKGRGDWKGKEALRLAHCSAEKNGCTFKARFCRVAHGLEIFTSGSHDIKAHLTPRKRGLAPAARAIVTKYKEESQSKLVEWLKDGGLLDGVSGDLEKVKQQIKRRKMTLKRKQKRAAGATSSQSGDSLVDEDSLETEPSMEDDESGQGQDEEDDPLCTAKIQLLQDDPMASLVAPTASDCSRMENSSQNPSRQQPERVDSREHRVGSSNVPRNGRRRIVRYHVPHEEEYLPSHEEYHGASHVGYHIAPHDDYMTPPPHDEYDSYPALPGEDAYNSDEEDYPDGAPYVGMNPFGDTGPYSPTTVVDVDSPAHSFHYSMFEHAPCLHTNDMFPRATAEYAATSQFQNAAKPSKRMKLSNASSTAEASTMETSTSYYRRTAV